MSLCGGVRFPKPAGSTPAGARCNNNDMQGANPDPGKSGKTTQENWELQSVLNGKRRGVVTIRGWFPEQRNVA